MLCHESFMARRRKKSTQSRLEKPAPALLQSANLDKANIETPSEQGSIILTIERPHGLQDDNSGLAGQARELL